MEEAPTPTTTNIIRCPARPHPPGTDTQSVYMCAHEGGWWFGEKWHCASTEPAKYLCLHNTRGQTGRAGKLGRHEERCREKYNPPPPLFRLNVSLLIKEEKKRWLP